jgi:hypothetical protein
VRTNERHGWVHTVLHGYLMAVEDAAGITYRHDDSMVALFEAI